MRIIFVGIHNKPFLKALCPSTKTGKLVNRIIDKLPKEIEIVKTNLFDVDYMPLDAQEMINLSHEWYWAHLPTCDDIIVLLGSYVHKAFKYDLENVIKIAHPTSNRSHADMDEYVIRSSELINKILNNENRDKNYRQKN